jgi:hypothetical protein
MRDIGASTRQFEKFRSLVLIGIPVEGALARIGAPLHVQAFVAHTMAFANSGSTEAVLAAFFYGREDVIPEMFRRLLDTLYGVKSNARLRHFIYYIDPAHRTRWRQSRPHGARIAERPDRELAA